ncbi:hypothetical protein ACDH32_002623 [Salmonella enterica]|nr:hypothetical protein EC2722950_2007 [Escherichia coli 2722950]
MSQRWLQLLLGLREQMRFFRLCTQRLEDKTSFLLHLEFRESIFGIPSPHEGERSHRMMHPQAQRGQ